MSPTFQVGDRVRIHRGRGTIPGVVVEDLGPIGFHGRRLYHVRVPVDPSELTTYELPEEEIERLDESTESETALDKQKAIAFLKHGGLISILRSNLAGGRNQPRVWLRPDSLGNATHTFMNEWGIVGGRPVPFQSLHGDKVFTPKRDEVVSLLRSFGLDRNEAEDIVATVGTAP